MRVGVVQMPVDPWPVSVERARELEAMGFDRLWVYDHLSWRHYQDSDWHATMPWLTGIACNTERIGLGTMVASPNLRHPLSLAKEAMSLDHISNGRITLGLGAGTAGLDATVFGDEALDRAQRADRLAEYATVLDGLLRGVVQNHEGEWYAVSEGRVIPGCVQRPRVPLAIAAGGRRTIGLAAALADTWITLGDTAEPATTLDRHVDDLAEQVKLLVTACERLGRDPDDVAKLSFVPSSFSEPLASIDAFIEFASRMADLGFTDVVVHDLRPDDPALAFDPEVIAAIAAWGRSQPV